MLKLTVVQAIASWDHVKHVRLKDLLRTNGEVVGIGLDALSASRGGMPAKLYRLLCELATRGLGLAPDTGGALVSLSFRPGRWLLDLDLLEERVVGGDDLSSHEARVEDDLFRRRSFVSPSVLELPDDPSTSCGSLFAKEAFERRRMEWNKEGISGRVEHNGS